MKRTFAALILILLSWTVYADDMTTDAAGGTTMDMQYVDAAQNTQPTTIAAQPAEQQSSAEQPVTQPAAPAAQPLLPDSAALDKLGEKVDLQKVTAQGKKTLIYLVSKTPDALQQTHTYVISLPDKYKKYLFAPVQARRWFVAGAIVFGLGIIVGLYIGKLAWRSKKYMLR